MKKISLLFFVIALVLQSCSGSDTKNNVPAGGAGKDQAPTATSADSSNGYGDRTHSDSIKK
jgi:uncharacterized protein YceK